VPKFVASHLLFVESNVNRNRFIAPYLARLEKVAQIIERREKQRKLMLRNVKAETFV